MITIFEPNMECVLVCYCTLCDGRIFDNQHAAEDHIDSIMGPVEFVLVNIGLN